MRRFAFLFRAFVLRGMVREKTRALLTALGIALGVAVIVAVRVANRSALESFRVATESVAGRTSLEITGVLGRFDELLLRDLLWLRDYGVVSPVIEGFAVLSAEPGSVSRGETLEVLGVDMLRDRPLRDYHLVRFRDEEREEGEGSEEGTAPAGREILDLLTEPASIILTERLAKRRGISIGEEVSLLIDDRLERFTVRGLLLDRGPARALDGAFGLLDIATAQRAFDRLGLLDRIDVRLARGMHLDRATGEIERRLPPELVVREPADRYRQVETMISSFHFNLSALASLALIVGLFLIYNTVTFSVVRRRREIGRLRAVGASRRTVFALFLGEAIALALTGLVSGVFLGRWMAGAAVEATASTVATFYIAEAARETTRELTLGRADWIAAIGLALPLSVLAAFLPALDASRVPPAAAARGAPGGTTRGGWWRALIPPAALAALSALLSRPGPTGELPISGYLAALSALFAGAFLVPPALRAACSAGDLVSRHVRSLGAESLLASAGLRSATGRVSISVAALAVSLAMTVAIAIMVSSFRRTVIDWLHQTLSAEIFVRPAATPGSLAGGSLSPEAVGMIRSHPEVAHVDALIRREIVYGDRRVTLGARDIDAFLEHGGLDFVSPPGARERIAGALARETAEPIALVSESFSLRFSRGPGDTVELPTRRGPQTFRVVAVFRDYSNHRGVVLIDGEEYARSFALPGEMERPSDLAVHLEPGADPARVREDLLRESSEEGRRLLLRTSGGVLERSLRIFDSTFSITWSLQVIAVAIAGLGVVATLVTLLLERRGELAISRFLGATRGQVRRLVVLEAAAIGCVSQGIGIAVGCALSAILIYVINVQSFGWTIRFHLPAGYLLQSSLFTVLGAAVAGFVPALRASRIDAVQFVAEE